MQFLSSRPTRLRRILKLLVCGAATALPLSASGALIALSEVPLTNATTTSVRPNLLFVLDASGSMDQEFTPDYLSSFDLHGDPWTHNGIWNSPSANQKNCRDSADDNGSISTALTEMDMCVLGDVPFMTSTMNTQYYNPAINYTPGVQANGASFPSQDSATTSNWTAVVLDGYNKNNKTQTGDTPASKQIDLTTQYPDRIWCTTQTPSAADKVDTNVCRKNADYSYPNATYKYGRDNNATIQDRNVLGVYGAPYYYDVVVSEYCKEAELRTCTASATPVGDYIFPAKSRWCNSTALTDCQSTKTSTFVYPRYPGAGSVPAYAFTRVDITPSTTSYPKASARTDCQGATCTYAEEMTNFANWYAYYRSRMQAMKSSVSLAFKPVSTNYRVGFMNIYKGSYLPINDFNSGFAVDPVEAAGSITLKNLANTSGRAITTIKVGSVNVLGATVSGSAGMSSADLATAIANQINSYHSSPEYTATASGDVISILSTINDGASGNGTISCAGPGYSFCGSGSSANPVQSKINMTGGVTGVGGQKMKWYASLFAATPSGGTPLRDALATAGRVFAGKELSVAGSTSGNTIDPLQYSCQQNFLLLTTDGYWNGGGGNDLNATAIGNLDASPVVRPKFEGPTASSGSLADVSKYYYDTDLRTPALNNCTGSLGLDVCANNVFVSTSESNQQQHMTTFTLGLGVDGTLSYVSDYKTATSGDYYKLKNGLGVNWPVPAADSQTAVDDLWHAAVNGEGTYFSAKDPAQLSYGLTEALAAIGAKIGAASAAATSTLTPISGDNFAYVASYATVKWQGNLEARTINVSTGEVSQTATWCVENIIAGTCTSPSSVLADSSNSSLVYYCVTPDSDGPSCPAPGILDGTDCKVPMTTACTGTLQNRIVNKNTDTRKIYKNNGSGGLESFEWANLDSTEQTYFSAGTTSLWSHWSTLTPDQQTAAVGENLVNYLRGHTKYEHRTSNTATDRLYRFREATLGDALESQPLFVGKPAFDYADPGYADFKTAQASRGKTVYLGTNDGMLHAFDATDGSERWAFIPQVLIPKLWKLADKNYASSHTNFVNGSPVVADICVAGCDAAGTAQWKTILVGGLNAGGRSFYALDVTDPDSPKLLWEITPATSGFADLGYSFGLPIVTKNKLGQWVVLLTSGYNNVSPGDGKGYLYVVDANDGTVKKTIATGAGSTTTPSGLARVATWNEYPGIENTAEMTYGGDLLGNLWRFDINDSASTAFKLAELRDPSNNPQAVTMAPVLGKVQGRHIVFVGTGKYLEASDLSNTSIQTLYAIKDENASSTLNVRDANVLVQQTLTLFDSGAKRKVSKNSVDWATKHGWYIDLGDSEPPSPVSFVGERVNVEMRLVQGTLVVATIVPSNTVCSPGGYSWLNFFDYATGGYVNNATQIASAKYTSPIVGFNIIYINKKPVVEVVTASQPTPSVDPNAEFGKGLATFGGKRIQWRELIP